MRILIASVFQYGHIGPAYRKGFEDCGETVFSFDLENQIFPEMFLKNRIFKYLSRSYYAFCTNQLLIKTVLEKKPDLLFLTKGHLIFPETLKKIKQLSVKIFNFYPDSPFEKNNTSPFVRLCFPYYDCFFTFAKHLISELLAAGCQRVEYLPFARDPLLHAPYQGSEDLEYYRSDISFVGNWDATRMGWLKSLENYEIKLWGENLRRMIPKGTFARGKINPAVYGEEYAKVMRASKITLNFMRKQNKQSHNMRSFEALACGAFMLSERTSEIVKLFKEDQEFVCFSTPDELQKKINYYLDHSEERSLIAKAGWERVKNDTYTRRAEQILKTYQSLYPA